MKKSGRKPLKADIKKIKTHQEPFVPNEKTIRAMKGTRHGKLITIGSVDNLLAKLNDEDN